jgi:hypothetical protein
MLVGARGWIGDGGVYQDGTFHVEELEAIGAGSNVCVTEWAG